MTARAPSLFPHQRRRLLRERRDELEEQAEEEELTEDDCPENMEGEESELAYDPEMPESPAEAAAAVDPEPPAAAADPNPGVAPDVPDAAAPRPVHEVIPDRLPADAVRVDVGDHGVLIYYPSLTSCVAFCRHPAHDKCRKQRTLLPGRKKGQGRPLGFLASWLTQAGDYRDSADHVHCFVGTLARRQAGRNYLLACPGSDRLFRLERPRHEGEDEEPAEFT